MSLTPFQKEKLEYYFNFFDSDGNGHLEMSDIEGFMKKVYEYTGWAESSCEARECYEVHECFFSAILEKADKPGSEKINLDKWYRMWEHLIPGCTAMVNFPIWLRLLPKTLFRIIDKKKDGKIDEKELSEFYVKFVGIPKENVTSLTSYAMEQMTDFGKYPLTLASYEQIFANFLIGKTPYGPGRFIFGCFEHMVERTAYRLIQGPGEEDVDPVLELKRLQIVQNSPTTPTAIVKAKFSRCS